MYNEGKIARKATDRLVKKKKKKKKGEICLMSRLWVKGKGIAAAQWRAALQHECAHQF